MKKAKTLCVALLLAMAGGVAAQAQSFSYGIVAGLNLTKLKYSGNMKENFSSDNKAGWYVGPKVAFNTVIGIGIDAALEYSERNLSITNDAYDELGLDGNYVAATQTKTYRTFEIPVNVRYNIGFGKKAGVYVATGPQFGFALQNMKWNKVCTGGNFSKQNMNVTWNIGAGLRLLNHLEVGIGYNMALGKAGKAIWKTVGGSTGESTDAELNYKTNTFQVQLAYMF